MTSEDGKRVALPREAWEAYGRVRNQLAMEGSKGVAPESARRALLDATEPLSARAVILAALLAFEESLKTQEKP